MRSGKKDKRTKAFEEILGKERAEAAAIKDAAVFALIAIQAYALRRGTTLEQLAEDVPPASDLGTAGLKLIEVFKNEFNAASGSVGGSLRQNGGGS